MSEITRSARSSPRGAIHRAFPLAGSMALANAENLLAVTLAQLVNPGTPVVYGIPSADIDDQHGTLTIGSPESALFASFAGQMARYYDLPSRAGGALTDAKTVDYQAGAESAFLGRGQLLRNLILILSNQRRAPHINLRLRLVTHPTDAGDGLRRRLVRRPNVCRLQAHHVLVDDALQLAHLADEVVLEPVVEGLLLHLFQAVGPALVHRVAERRSLLLQALAFAAQPPDGLGKAGGLLLQPALEGEEAGRGAQGRTLWPDRTTQGRARLVEKKIWTAPLRPSGR